MRTRNLVIKKKGPVACSGKHLSCSSLYVVSRHVASFCFDRVPWNSCSRWISVSSEKHPMLPCWYVLNPDDCWMKFWELTGSGWRIIKILEVRDCPLEELHSLSSELGLWYHQVACSVVPGHKAPKFPNHLIYRGARSLAKESVGASLR